MAKVSDEFPQKNRKEWSYPWDRWFDGQVWELAKGEDYGTNRSVMFAARQAAVTRGLAIRTRSVESGRRVFIQAIRTDS